MTEQFRHWHNITLLSHVCLLVTIIIWYFFISPPQYILSTIFSLVYVLILLLPAPGLFKKTYRVYMWSGYLILVYFTHGIIEAWANPIVDEKILAVIEIVLSSIYFVAAMMCFRYARNLNK